MSSLPIWCYISQPLCTLHNFNKQHLILAKFYINNATSIGNQCTKFQLNLSVQTIVTVAFLRSPQNVKWPVIGNRLFNPHNVHGLLGNFAINFLASYSFFCLNSLLKTTIVCRKHHFVIVYVIFIVSTNVTFAWTTAVCNAMLVTKIFCYRYSTFNNFCTKWYFSTKLDSCFMNLLGINCTKLHLDSFRFDILLHNVSGRFLPYTVYF